MSKIDSNIVFVPGRWLVVVTVQDAETGTEVLVSRHECRDFLHAQRLMSEVHELAAGISAFLPGLSAMGYEILEAHQRGPSEGMALAALTIARGGDIRTTRWWAETLAELQAMPTAEEWSRDL